MMAIGISLDRTLIVGQYGQTHLGKIFFSAFSLNEMIRDH